MELFEIIPLKGNFDDLPEPDVPHYLIAKEGVFLRKKTVFGNVLLKQTEMPPHLPSIGDGNKYGIFHFQKERRIPVYLMNQAWGFFRKVYSDQGTEAEVLILLNYDTGRFRLFVPYQIVSGSGVDSIYDPVNIPEGFSVVGSIHSHCNFDAFHSGTDTADASTFNGLHITIGNVNADTPSVAAMVMVNGTQFTYKNIETVAEITGFRPIDVPKQWYNYLYDYKHSDDIKNVKFPSLTEKDVSDWITGASSVVVVKHENNVTKWYDRDSWGSDSKFSYSGNYNSDTRYCIETKCYVPNDWLKPNGEIKQKFIKRAYQTALENLFKNAERRDLLIFYRIESFDPTDEEGSLSNVDRFDKVDDKVSDDGALLPGPFSVIDPEKEEKIEEFRRLLSDGS